MTNKPIVLAHGIARFDILRETISKKSDLGDRDRLHYFKGIKTHLEANGFRVFHSNQDFAGPVESRAEQLKLRVNEVLSATGAEKVHIIGHSMGGLDARHMIVDMGMAERVATLTTIGTPHLGDHSGGSRNRTRGSFSIGFTTASDQSRWICRPHRDILRGL